MRSAAKEALGTLPGENINKEIIARLSKAEAKTYPVLIELVGQRRIDAVPELLKAINSSDRVVHLAALTGRAVHGCRTASRVLPRPRRSVSRSVPRSTPSPPGPTA